jgi:hypothetical protein
MLETIAHPTTKYLEQTIDPTNLTHLPLHVYLYQL